MSDLRGHRVRDLFGPLVNRDLWCPCWEYMKGDGHSLCPRCEDESARGIRAAEHRRATGHNICRGQE